MVFEFILYVYYAVLFGLVALGILRYRIMDNGSKRIFYLMVLALLCETITKYNSPFIKSPTYHIYNLLEMVVITSYFIYTVRIKHKWIYLMLCLFYIGIEVTNDILYQPLRKFNSNFIIFECLLVIPMALYSLYKILINDSIEEMRKYVHFWFWTMLLVYFSSSFFFWPFVVYFYKHNQTYYNISSYTHLIVNLIVYTGMLLTFLYYPKMARDES